MAGNVNRASEKPPSIDRLSAVWRKVNDRKIAQWTGAYVALAYAIQHGVILTSESYEWPNLVARISMTLLALGLPVVMVCAWYHGEKASRRISGPELTIIAILLAIGSLFFYVLMKPAEQVARSVPTVQQAGVTAARSDAANPRLGIAVAVMPFANLSGDKDQEYFSDGMTDEISGALAKIPDLRVVARSSAFQFKDKNQDARTIGKALGATHLIEGSVRKVGDQLRISAELVKTDAGVTAWSNSYDRQLKDVFAIQEDIARAVATSLHMTLGLKPGEQLIEHRPRDPALHDEYLRARNLVRTRQQQPTEEGIRLLNDVVKRDPDYAAAWSALAFAYQGFLLINPVIASGLTEQAKPLIEDLLEKIGAAAQQAVTLDPNDPSAYCALALIQLNRNKDQVAAWELRQRGLTVDPDDPECLNGEGTLTANLGFVQRVLPLRDHLLAIEPFVPVYRAVTARLLFAAGQTDAAMAMLKDLRGGGAFFLTAQIEASQGHFRVAAEALNKASANVADPAASSLIATAVRLLRAAPTPAPQEDRRELGILNWVYLYTGAPERFMNTYENQVRMGYLSGAPNALEWAPAYHSVRQTQRFKNWIRNSGIFAYWKAKGWPPQCHPTTGDDFECS